jgi:hypothetical protein
VWPLECTGGRQVAVGHLIVAIDITGTFFVAFYCGWLQGLLIFITETSFCWWLVHFGEHVMFLVSSHTIAVNPFMSPIFNFSFFSLKSVDHVFLFGLHCPAYIYFSGFLGHQKVCARKITVHRKFVSCAVNYVNHISNSRVSCRHVCKGGPFVLT